MFTKSPAQNIPNMLPLNTKSATLLLMNTRTTTNTWKAKKMPLHAVVFTRCINYVTIPYSIDTSIHRCKNTLPHRYKNISSTDAPICFYFSSSTRCCQHIHRITETLDLMLNSWIHTYIHVYSKRHWYESHVLKYMLI